MKWFLSLIFLGAALGCPDYCGKEIVKPGKRVTIEYVYPNYGKDECLSWVIRAADDFPLKIVCNGTLAQSEDCTSTVTILSAQQKTTSTNQDVTIFKWIDESRATLAFSREGNCETSKPETLTCIFYAKGQGDEPVTTTTTTKTTTTTTEKSPKHHNWARRRRTGRDTVAAAQAYVGQNTVPASQPREEGYQIGNDVIPGIEKYINYRPGDLNHLG